MWGLCTTSISKLPGPVNFNIAKGKTYSSKGLCMEMEALGYTLLLS